MNCRALAFGIAAIAWSVPAAAQEMRYGWCETKAVDGNYLMSGLMQQPKGTSDDAYKQAFRIAVGGQGDIACWFYYSTPSEGKSHFGQRQYVIESQEKRRYTLTGWVGPYGVAGAQPKKPGGAFLTVKEDRGGAEAADSLRDAVLRAQRDEAAMQAKAIANTARQRADMQAKLDKLFEEMRNRRRELRAGGRE